MMPIVRALLAFAVSLVRSRVSLQVERLAMSRGSFQGVHTGGALQRLTGVLRNSC